MSLLEKLGNINQLTYKVLHDMNSCYVILKYNLPKVNTLMMDSAKKYSNDGLYYYSIT